MNQPGGRRRMGPRHEFEKEFKEIVVQIKRVSKKTKGGNQISFTALMVIGDGKGRVGVSLGKAKDVASAIRKGIRQAKKGMVKIPLKGTTIPRQIKYKKKSAVILLKPAREGTGLVAGGAIRAIASVSGIKDLVAKIIGSRNKAINVQATWEALQKLEAERK